ncbi:DUF4249 domain-containing protein [Mesonia maritima]|uniref:DUF4249 domain-containing protein n=1 Tax=Mesonia maritima TaxID=1793873 RepID=A0ABU1K947_9FLAO|nr:DUF4249 domain-containing protein [Mesonia maritima]MDR6301572.1 hypothetical protein [Mesonia maritima]
MKTLYKLIKTMWTFAILISINMFLISCEEVIEVDLEASDNILVIDAEILWEPNTSGNSQKIYLSRLTNYYNTETQKVSDAQVEITNTNGDIFTFTETDEPGTYQCNDFLPEIENTYHLRVVVDNEIYTATETMVGTPEIIKVEQGKDGGFSQDDYEVIFYFNDPEEEENYYLEDFQSDFLIYPEYGISSDEFFNGNEIDFSFSDEDLETGSTVDIRFRGISEQFYNYMSLILETTNANPFATPPANIRGNIVNETNKENYALGYFRLSEVQKKSYTIQEVN